MEEKSSKLASLLKNIDMVVFSYVRDVCFEKGLLGQQGGRGTPSSAPRERTVLPRVNGTNGFGGKRLKSC